MGLFDFLLDKNHVLIENDLHAIQNPETAPTISKKETVHIEKYRALDERSRHMLDVNMDTL